jgi:hypothetical protein
MNSRTVSSFRQPVAWWPLALRDTFPVSPDGQLQKERHALPGTSAELEGFLDAKVEPALGVFRSLAFQNFLALAVDVVQRDPKMGQHNLAVASELAAPRIDDVVHLASTPNSSGSSAATS